MPWNNVMAEFLFFFSFFLHLFYQQSGGVKEEPFGLS